MEAGGILDVCENCDYILTMQDENSILEIELKKNFINYISQTKKVSKLK